MVELTQARQTLETGFVIPAGTRGRILGMHKGEAGYNWLVDFGLATVITLPCECCFIKMAADRVEMPFDGRPVAQADDGDDEDYGLLPQF